jgi:hypothetical protein
MANSQRRRWWMESELHVYDLEEGTARDAKPHSKQTNTVSE